MKRTETMWAIAGTWSTGRPFLYTGTYFTRKDAIWDHEQKKGCAWKLCRKRGDRAVKVIVTWEAP